MSYTAGVPDTALDPAFERDLLAVADTKLVLGNWYAECVMNGRSLPDFAAILGMCTANYGHTRAIFQYLTAHGRDYVHLERGRGPDGIHSMNLLDEAPADWEDFMVATWLAELASWMMISGFLGHADRAIAGLAKKIGQETYYHLKYADGWRRVIGEGKAEAARFQKHFERRYPLALQWFGPVNAADEVYKAGLRDMDIRKIREAFARESAKGKESLKRPLKLAKSVKFGNDWRSEARRTGPLPRGLFDVIRFKDPDLAH